MSVPVPAEILVVDDDPDIQTLLHMVLTEEGYAVRVAGDGEAALTAIAEAVPALVLLDLNLPRLDGWAVHQRLVDQQVQVPIVVMTAGASAVREATRLGVEGALPKPFDVEFLLRIVARFAS